MNDDINISNDRDLLDNDTDGHGMRVKIVKPAADDTDGHGMRFKGVQPAEGDTDGHMYRPGR
jgi:hypothetical protein